MSEECPNDTEQEIQQADAFKKLSELPDDHAHAAVVDYPWQFEIQNRSGRYEYRGNPRGRGEGDRDPDHEDTMFEMADDEAVTGVLAELSRVLVDGAWIIFMADDRFQDVVRNGMRDVTGTIFRRNWAWTPESMGMGYYGRVDHYPIPVATVGETDRYVSDRPTLFRVPRGRQTDYPTGKPIKLYRELLESPVIQEGERLLEPFCGSGPGAAVAAERGLSYWGCDVDVDAVEAARSHFNQDRLAAYADGGNCSLHTGTKQTGGEER
ncbi:hypothetical protein [Halomontanus rarus]|uniref:hypothetical protein n=1 Tax=Halomontanus rarus TaxID=3034020 RepID=UPI0023E87704|nr:hypothetical protein [Halovivax sp. TS33]